MTILCTEHVFAHVSRTSPSETTEETLNNAFQRNYMYTES